MPSAPALDYAPTPTTRRPWMRRVWPVGLLLIVAALGIAYGPGLWRRWQVIKLQEACMTAQMPTDRPVWEQDPVAARALIAAWPGEYVLDPWNGALRVDSRWTELAGALGSFEGVAFQSRVPRDTAFCHERRTPDGRRRLVVVEGWFYVTLIEPAAWPVGDGPRVVFRGTVTGSDAGMVDDLYKAEALMSPIRSGAGIPDPADPTRFTAPFSFNGIPGTWEYRLGNDDHVTMRLLDPEGFIARANAAKAKAATAP